MSQSPPSAGRNLAAMLERLPRRTMTAEEQLQAVQRIRVQAEQRVKLGTELLAAADARLATQKALLDQSRAEQAEQREALLVEVTQRLSAHEQQQQMDRQSLDQTLTALAQRLAALEQQQAAAPETRATDQILSVLVERIAALEEQQITVPDEQAPDPALNVLAERLAALEQHQTVVPNERAWTALEERVNAAAARNRAMIETIRERIGEVRGTLAKFGVAAPPPPEVSPTANKPAAAEMLDDDPSPDACEPDPAHEEQPPQGAIYLRLLTQLNKAAEDKGRGEGTEARG